MEAFNSEKHYPIPPLEEIEHLVVESNFSQKRQPLGPMQLREFALPDQSAVLSASNNFTKIKIREIINQMISHKCPKL